MRLLQRILHALIVCLSLLLFSGIMEAQTGNSSTISGTVEDPSGAVVANATVTIHNAVSGYERTATTNSSGNFSFPNVPFNPYHLTVSATGFATYAQDVEVRSGVPVEVAIKLSLAGTASSITVESSGDLLENDPTAHTDIARQLFDRVPLESTSSSLSSLVTQASPGVTADSNGLFHGLGDHAENSFSVDGQPITDQQSKVFSNQIPTDAVQSLEVIDGAPPAEYGDKTSLVIDVTTRSGQGMTVPHGAVTASYGSFGTSTLDFNFGYGGPKWGNFIAISGLNTGRFLDPPEFTVMHDKGNEENFFDRVDYQFSSADSAHMNVSFTRSWFQNPNSFDSELATAWNGMVVNTGGIGPNGVVVGAADQRSQIRTLNIAPTWTHLIGSAAVLTSGVYIRRDQYNYYPSANPFADLGPPSLQRESVGQLRFLTNAGVHSDISYARGIHNFKAGLMYEQTFLAETDNLGIADPTLNAPCVNAGGSAVPGFTDPSQCAAAGLQPNTAANPNALNSAQFPNFSPLLLPFDLTRGGGLFGFSGRGDVKELALYIEDTITKGNWSFNLGMRGDLYNGLSTARQAEPRFGIAYQIHPTNTVMRISYARTLETPYNENLVLSSTGCSFAVIAALVPCVPASLAPGLRNEFHAGLQQAFTKHLVIDGEYLWKYTHNAYDFSVFGNTPIFFPIEWHNSKIRGFTLRANITNFRGFTAYVNMSSVAARFFTPQVGGLGTIPAVAGTGFSPFRIDHDEVFNQNTHFQYQPWQRGPWLGFNWRYDSGLVAGASPCFGMNPANTCPGSFLSSGGQPFVSMVVANAGGVPMSADQEFQAGFFCGNQRATPTQPLPSTCPASQFGSSLIRVPAPGTENDDHNPPRIAPRNLFDLAVGDDNLFGGDRYKWSARFTVINLANKVALYNFLSTFSGTHYVTPRTFAAELGFHF